MVAASVQTEPVFRVTERDVLFVDTYDRIGTNDYADYDIDPRSGRFLMIKPSVRRGDTEIIVVLNWVEELRRRMGN